GAILMQQVRAVLLGVRQLPLLTPKRYVRAGGLRGAETMVISRALQRASEAIRDREQGLRAARTLLNEMVQPGDSSQQPKARRVSLVLLTESAGKALRAEAFLRVLQEGGGVRPAGTLDGVSAWQLDHDYLARAVIAEARQADRWSLVLREGKAQYETA